MLFLVGGTAAALLLPAALLRRDAMPEIGPGRHQGGATAQRHNDAKPETHAQAMRPRTVTKPVSCEKLPNVPGKSITTVVVEFPPGAYSPAHRHPGSVTAYVLKGTVRSQLAGGPIGTYKPGDTWFEPLGALHLFAENVSDAEPAELLAVFVADDNCGPLVIPER